MDTVKVPALKCENIADIDDLVSRLENFKIEHEFEILPTKFEKLIASIKNQKLKVDDVTKKINELIVQRNEYDDIIKRNETFAKRLKTEENANFLNYHNFNKSQRLEIEQKLVELNTEKQVLLSKIDVKVKEFKEDANVLISTRLDEIIN